MTGLQEIISKKIGEDVVEFIRREHRTNSYGTIACMITKATGIRLTPETIGIWARGER